MNYFFRKINANGENNIFYERVETQRLLNLHYNCYYWSEANVTSCYCLFAALNISYMNNPYIQS